MASNELLLSVTFPRPLKRQITVFNHARPEVFYKQLLCSKCVLSAPASVLFPASVRRLQGHHIISVLRMHGLIAPQKILTDETENAFQAMIAHYGSADCMTE